MTPAISDTGSLIDGPARTLVLVLGGVTVLGWLLAWLLCRAAAVANRIEPGCDDIEALHAAFRQRASEASCLRQGHHDLARFSDLGDIVFCLNCGQRQRGTEVYDNVAIERLHADLAAFERGER